MPPKDKTSPYVPAKAIADFLSRYASPDETGEVEQDEGIPVPSTYALPSPNIQNEIPAKFLPPPPNYNNLSTPSSQGLLDLPIFPGGAGSLAAQTLAAAYLPKAISALPEPLQVPTQIGLLAAPFVPKVPGAAVSSLKWATQPKHIGAGAERLSKLMMKHPESGIQKGLNELFGSLAKTKAFSGQMESTPLAGQMFSHYFTGQGTPLTYKFPTHHQQTMAKVRHSQISDIARKGKVGDSFSMPIKEGSVVRDVQNALGNFTLQGKVVKRITPYKPRKAGEPLHTPLTLGSEGGDAIVRLRNYDTYNFKPQYIPEKTWTFRADIPTSIANKLPNFRINNPTSGYPTAKAYSKTTQQNPSYGSLYGTTEAPLLDISKISSTNYLIPRKGRKRGEQISKGGTTKVNISGLDAVFPKLGVGKPFSSYSKPYYYNTKTRKVGNTLKSVL